jgi:3-oxoacyl-[acyl-carrier-protein] synthase-3
MKSRIAALDYFLPVAELTNEQLAVDHPDWKIAKISAKTGIRTRRIAGDDEYTSDLAVGAARKLFADHGIDPADVDYLILCTQSPDYFLPTTACIVQAEIGMRLDVGAIDITLGCSGFVYALGLAKGLIESGQVRNVLVITAETHSKFANPDDKSTRPIFGDGAAATLVVADPTHDGLSGVTFGTDGSGGPGLVVPNGGLREADEFSPNSSIEARNLRSNGYDMYMDGLEIFNFTIRVVPGCVDNVLRGAGLTMADVDLFVFHQANGYLIEHLRKKLEIPAEKFVVSLEDYGNTGSSTIPIAMTDALNAGRVKKGSKIMLVGFGVGLSWGGVLVTW